MKNHNTFCVLLLTLVLASTATILNAQSILGSWKKTDEVLIKEDGIKKSTYKMMLKNMPCFQTIVYSFLAGGKMDETAKDCAAPVQKLVAGDLTNARWKITGNKLIIDVAGKNALVKHAVYQIDFNSNNEMIWTFIYADNPGVPNATRAKQMQTTYVRIGS